MKILNNQPLISTSNTAKPFLRWAGGKSWFIKHLNNYIPVNYNNYHEVFLGGGAIFFNKQKSINTYLSDLNNDLINAYTQVRDNVEELISQLGKIENNKETYYKVRSAKYDDLILKATQFIYLNKTSFNGIYRVNSDGNYNVPYGFRSTDDYIEANNLRKASEKLKCVNIETQDFEYALNNVNARDFVFIDPPYTVAHEKNGFIAYNQKLFTLDDQYRLRKCLERLNSIGAHFVLTNAYHATIKDIYNNVGEFQTLERISLIGGRGAVRKPVKEYVIKNF